MATYTQANRPMSITTPLGKDVLLLTGFEGEELISGIFRFRVDLLAEKETAVKFDAMGRLIGVRLIGGVQPRVEAWFEVTEPPPGDLQFNVTSTIFAKAKYSLIPIDKTDRNMGFPPPLPTKLWKVGYLYSTVTVLNHRIGRERYVGAWASRDGCMPPHRTDHKGDTTLATLE